MKTRRNIKGGDSFFGSMFGTKPAQPTPAESGPMDISPGNTIDEKVKEILGLTGYHMRAIINAISICNSTMKMQNNAAGVGNSVLNAFGRGNESKLEMTKCGSQCKERASKVKDALETLLKVSENTDVLGYIASGTSGLNSASYVGSLFSSTPKSVALEPQQSIQPPQPEIQPQPPQPVSGGRRRRTRRR